MTTAHQKGLWAEKRAEMFLRLKGYAILHTRFKTPVGEIDIVARTGRVLVFAEVKARGTRDAAAEAIHAKNQERVRRAAELYLQKYPEYNDFDIRFDAVILGKDFLPQHIISAF